MTCSACGQPVYFAARCGLRHCYRDECLAAGRWLHEWTGTPTDHRPVVAPVVAS